MSIIVKFVKITLLLLISWDFISAHKKFSSNFNKKYNKLITQHNRKESEMESKLLELLGLSRRPKRLNAYPPLNKSASKYLLNIFENINDDDVIQDNASRKTRSALNFITDLDEMEIEKCNNIITFFNRGLDAAQSILNDTFGIKLWFNVDQIPKELSLIKSELRIFQNPSSGIYLHSEWTFTISMYQIDINRNLEIISSINTTSAYQGWLEIDITMAFQHWISHPRENFGITLKVEINGEEIIPQHIGLMNTQDQYEPFVVGFFNGPEVISKVRNLRMKREIKTFNQKSFETAHNKMLHDIEDFQAPKICQRMNFSVDFRELNWSDWIIAPEKFDAFFCSGECNFPLGAGMNATNHALVQTLMHLKQPSLPKPCCAPVSLSSISVLYYLNQDSVNLRKYRHMIVKSCGCH